jgi:hypothetical protein
MKFLKGLNKNAKVYVMNFHFPQNPPTIWLMFIHTFVTWIVFLSNCLVVCS